MFDDTRETQLGDQGRPSPRPHAQLMQTISKIQSSSTIREHANRWAESLRFLTFDDGAAENSEAGHTNLSAGHGEDDPIHGQCQPCSRKTPIPSGHVCYRHSRYHDFKAREDNLHSYANPCVHVREHSCNECRHVPLFPNESKVTRFRIRRLHQPGDKDFVVCDHFVAVSYCWSSETDDRKNEEPYQVVEEDGSIRNARASKNTIDRVVAFARENGFRMVWIDQECIQQDNPAEKELAIQAMDHVYVRARRSIGLFHAQLEQKHLETLLLAYESKIGARFSHRRGKPVFTGCRSVDPTTMCEAVSKIVGDRWNTRAWILQEAFASSGNMLLLFPRLNKVDTRGWMLVCHELSQSELAIRMDVIQNCISICAPMIQRILLKDAAAETTPARRRKLAKPKEKKPASKNFDAKMLMKQTSLFHPGQPETPGSYHLNNMKPRRTCNAAVALTYLKTRDLVRPADKIAIVANMCGYHLRLDTIELEKTQKSLAVCVLALALSNGDLSLLIPQMYRQPEVVAPEFPSDNALEFTWIHSLTRSMYHMEAKEWNPFGMLAIENAGISFRLSEDGFSIPGLLWRKSHFVDLKRLQTKYAYSWHNLHKDKGPMGSSQNTLRLAATHILFEIIQSLSDCGEREAADSILNSTSNWQWNQNPREWTSTIIEAVDQFPPGLRIENRKGMFKLNSNPNGGYYEDWVIERVMEHGGLWIWAMDTKTGAQGNFVSKDEARANASKGTNSGTSAPAHEQYSQSEGSTTMDDTQVALSKHGKHLDPPSTKDINRSSLLEGKGHSQLLGTLNMMTKLIQFQAVHPDSEARQGSENKGTKDIDRHLISATSAPALLSVLLAGDSIDNEKFANRCAIFDMGEGIPDEQLVLTPFQMVLESVPRARIRSMSVSWTVEEIEKDGRFRVTDMVRGMWRFVLQPSGRYTIV